MIFINDYCGFVVGGSVTAMSTILDLSVMTQKMEFAQEPDYKNLIPPMQLRRMSKPIRLSIAAVKNILNEEHNENLGAINVGTAYGLLSDSELFLSQMVTQDEEMLTPTAFIQSTQNTIGGQIALMLKCPSHNMTFVQRGHSFEHALLDIELLDDTPSDNYILGGVDEMTPNFYDIMNKLMMKFDKTATDAVALGEGAAFFRISKEKKEETKCSITAYELFKAKDGEAVQQHVAAFFEKHQVKDAGQLHWVLGDISDKSFQTLYKPTVEYFGVSQILHYKPYTSDYPTVGAAGLAIAVKYLEEQQQEQVILLQNYLRYWSVFILER